MKTNYDLRKDVMDQISWTPQLHTIAVEFGVAARDGVVTISGIVDSYWKKVAVENTALKVSGVKAVRSEVVVSVVRSRKRTDTEIAQAVSSTLRWNSAIEDDCIDVRVDAGWVHLQGVCDSLSEMNAIQKIVENLKGVVGVTNEITLKSRSVDTIQLERKIAAAFHRSATLDSAAIRIDTAGNTVNLKGTVRSWAEKKEAESIASAAPGVVVVENEIEVDPAVLI